MMSQLELDLQSESGQSNMAPLHDSNVPMCVCRYRGLRSFRNSPWDPKENLPLDYAR